MEDRDSFIIKKIETLKERKINYNLLIACGTLLFTIYSYIISQQSIDKRHYNSAYYDERYKVLKNITKTIAEINILLETSVNYKFDSLGWAAIRAKTYIFSYSNLILSDKEGDLLLQNKLYLYRHNIFSMDVLDPIKTGKETIDIGNDIIINCGKILIHEKDSINSTKFYLF